MGSSWFIAGSDIVASILVVVLQFVQVKLNLSESLRIVASILIPSTAFLLLPIYLVVLVYCYNCLSFDSYSYGVVYSFMLYTTPAIEAQAITIYL